MGNKMLELYRDLEIKLKNLFITIATGKSFYIDSAKPANAKEMGRRKLRQEVFKSIVTKGQFCFFAHPYIHLYQVIAAFDHYDVIGPCIHIVKMLDKKTENIFRAG